MTWTRRRLVLAGAASLGAVVVATLGVVALARLPHRPLAAAKSSVSKPLATTSSNPVEAAPTPSPSPTPTPTEIGTGGLGGGGPTEVLPGPQLPQPRSSAAMAYDAARANVVLFGGYAGGTTVLGDTWTWDGSRWTEQHPPVSPSSRTGAQMAFDPVSRLTVLFGGGSGGTPHDDVWTWDGTTWVQKRADSPVVIPGAAPSPDATYPTYRGGIGMAFDAAVGKLVLITAGADGSQPSTTPDTWAWDGQTWRPLGHFARTTTNPYGNVHNGAVAEHPKTKRLVMFGGYSIAGDPAVDDTWTFDGTTWSKASVPTSPTPRTGAALAREQSGDLVLFGGVNLIASGETWKWNGSTWLQLHPNASPSARFYASMVYDSSRGLTILFGGATDATSNVLGAPRPPQNDIWTWDGVTWRQVA